MLAVSDSDLNEIQCRLIKAQLPAWNRIKTALAEAQKPSPNKQSMAALSYINEHSPDGGPWGLNVEEVAVVKRMLSA